MRCQLEPLQEEETKSYILRRLQRAGANSHATIMFPEETIASVYRYSRGIPRLINTVCENALIATYAEKALSVHPEVIDEVAKDLRLNVLSRAAVVSTSGMGSQHDIAKSLLELVNALERVARNTVVTETSSDHGVKIV
jgi:hypothetical protein